MKKDRDMKILFDELAFPTLTEAGEEVNNKQQNKYIDSNNNYNKSSNNNNNKMTVVDNHRVRFFTEELWNDSI